MKRIKWTYEKKKRMIGYLFILPWLLGSLFFFIIPLIQSVIYSVCELELQTGRMIVKYMGFDNYHRLFRVDPDAVKLLYDSLGKIIVQTVYITILSVFVAVILKQKFFGRLFARAVFFLPVVVTSGIVISIISGDPSTTQLMLGGEKSSMLVKSFELTNLLYEIGFTQEITLFLTGMIDRVFNITWVSGVQILILLAGLQTVPGHLYEASKIDGATPWESFWFITFPMISPILLLTTVYSIIDGLSDYSNQYQAKIVQFANQYMNYSYSSALSTVYFICVITLIGLVFLFTRKRVFYMVD
jgi:ABC-type sugar transport system permease subunit